ncbi:unnamed protein product [Acanthoscelides obtectus]|uniref:C2H2-type domain-containing protein n=1 Tax=Acanthoscelides obtectus TaxID=200917 RepID=A0A9P0LND6_ACAOB|nr:unnamed protein product [Acanthoscelides obtectus]CAK1675663.1 Zinc finger protein 62 homolog [Acanthoscelides obtectus]
MEGIKINLVSAQLQKRRKYFQCNSCHMLFDTQQKILTHQKKDSSGKAMCGGKLKFDIFGKLQIGRKYFQCTSCRTLFDTPQKILAHRKASGCGSKSTVGHTSGDSRSRTLKPNIPHEKQAPDIEKHTPYHTIPSEDAERGIKREHSGLKKVFRISKKDVQNEIVDELLQDQGTSVNKTMRTYKSPLLLSKKKPIVEKTQTMVKSMTVETQEISKKGTESSGTQVIESAPAENCIDAPLMEVKQMIDMKEFLNEGQELVKNNEVHTIKSDPGNSGVINKETLDKTLQIALSVTNIKSVQQNNLTLSSGADDDFDEKMKDEMTSNENSSPQDNVDPNGSEDDCDDDETTSLKSDVTNNVYWGLKSHGDRFQCVYCECVFDAVAEYLVHVNSIYVNVIRFNRAAVRCITESNIDRCDGRYASYCPVCQKNITNTRLKFHSCFHLYDKKEIDECNATTLNDGYFIRECRYCNKSLPADMLHLHFKYLHQDVTKGNRCFCKRCQTFFDTRKAAKKHKFMHDYKLCEICGKFVYAAAKATHDARHQGIRKKYNKPAVCDVCGKTIKNSKNLSVHKRSHMSASEKPFECYVCL